MRILHALRTCARRGFTLVELLAVILIIGLLVVALTPIISDSLDNAEAEACRANLRTIYQGLVIYKTKRDAMPTQSGVKFFAEVVNKEALQNTKANAERLTCPAVEVSFLTQGQEGLEPTQWWTDLDVVDGGWSAYAGRDMRAHPLRKALTDGNEPLVADDNDPSMNHRTTTNVLYANGSVETFELPDVREQGLVGADEEVLIVGPDSPIEDLRKLSLD